jgi:DNA-binding NarL/FixJ family response regulator
LRAGANGYVVKRSPAADVVRAVRALAAGGTYIDPSVAASLLARPKGDHPADLSGDDGLSDRERQVVMRIARGFSNKEIAARLGLSVKTVETYKARVAEKIGVRTRVDIVRYAVARGWLGEPSSGEA